VAGDRQALDLTLLPGARELLAVHARALPQRDDLCGAFSGALALAAAGIEERGGEPLDQDAVAIAAGSIVSAVADVGSLPHGEQGRRDYRLAIPFVEDSTVSGTTAAGVAAAVEELSGGQLAAIPYSGPWTAATLGGLFEQLAGLEQPVSALLNFATHHLWGGHATPAQLLDHLFDGSLEGPPPDWHVGHFACLIGRLRGPGGSLYGVADTYPSLGNRGVHLQPGELLAAALERRDMPAGGMIVVVHTSEAQAVRSGLASLGLIEGLWDNGTASPPTPEHRRVARP
jgi:hypothetical protein